MPQCRLSTVPGTQGPEQQKALVHGNMSSGSHTGPDSSMQRAAQQWPSWMLDTVPRLSVPSTGARPAEWPGRAEANSTQTCKPAVLWGAAHAGRSSSFPLPSIGRRLTRGSGLAGVASQTAAQPNPEQMGQASSCKQLSTRRSCFGAEPGLPGGKQQLAGKGLKLKLTSKGQRAQGARETCMLPQIPQPLLQATGHPEKLPWPDWCAARPTERSLATVASR